MMRNRWTAHTTGRIDWFWTALPYAILAVTSVLYLAEKPPATGLSRSSVGAVFLGLWHWWWAIRHGSQLGLDLLPMSVYFVGLLVSTAGLTLISFSFFPLYLMCFALAFVALPRAWAYLGMALTGVVAFVAPWLLDPTVDNVAAIVGGGALAAAAGWSIRALEQSQAELQESLAANQSLQDQLVDQARRAGILNERARIAGEFHDTVASGLTGVVSQLEALDAQLESESPHRNRVNIAADVARESLDEARRSIRALRPTALTRSSSLSGALAVGTTGFERTPGIPVEQDITGTEFLVNEPVEHGILRTCQEALANIARHSKATRVRITLSYLEDTIALDIADNGVGAGDHPPRTGGQGLHIMRQRITELGGTVEMDADSERGTTITVTVPILQAAQADD